jgi:hypothetical protein
MAVVLPGGGEEAVSCLLPVRHTQEKWVALSSLTQRKAILHQIDISYSLYSTFAFCGVHLLNK